MKVYFEQTLVGEVPSFLLGKDGSFFLRLVGIDLVIRKRLPEIHPVYQPFFTIMAHANGAVIKFPTPEKTLFINVQNRKPFIQTVVDTTVLKETE